jgi:plastocyanin
MRRGSVVLASLALLVLVALPALATSQVTIQDYSFSPTPIAVGQGGSVQWHNVASVNSHSSTSDLAGVWDTGHLAPTETSIPVVFQAAGTYAYHCSIHPFMHGKVRVPIKVSPASGSTSTIFTITLASASRTGYSFDVQKKVQPSGPWKFWRTGVTALSVTFHHTSAGSWRFRSRLHKNGSTAASGWSPTKMVTIS